MTMSFGNIEMSKLEVYLRKQRSEEERREALENFGKVGKRAFIHSFILFSTFSIDCSFLFLFTTHEINTLLLFIADYFSQKWKEIRWLKTADLFPSCVFMYLSLLSVFLLLYFIFHSLLPVATKKCYLFQCVFKRKEE